MLNRPRIIFDTDPGADDAIALLWLCALHRTGRIELLGITTTGGNVGRRQVFDNAARICALTGLAELPIARGAPHLGPHAIQIHGEDGLAGQSASLPATTLSFDAAPAADDLLANALQTEPDSITVVAVGPLTNLAAAEQRRPGCLRQARRIVVMGGGLDCGNITPHAEFNVYYNPTAWHRVLQAATPDVISMNITREVSLATDQLPQLSAPDTSQRFFLALAHSMVAAAQARGKPPEFVLHDAVAVAAACYPRLLSFRQAALEVCVDASEHHGRTWECATAPRNARLAVSADRDALVATLLLDTLGA